MFNLSIERFQIDLRRYGVFICQKTPLIYLEGTIIRIDIP